MKTLIRTILLAGALPLSAQATEIECVMPVDVIGIEPTIRAHDYGAVAWLRNLPIDAMTIGYGMGAGREFEVAIMDGKYNIVRSSDEAMIRSSDPSDLGMATLVRATPAAWVEVGALEDVWDLASLNLKISDIVQSMGCAGDVTLAFKITGQTETLDWALYGQPERARGQVSDTAITLVGLYSNHDKANTFLSPGYSLRAEAFTQGTGMLGEVTEISLQDGAVLFLAAAR